MEHEHGAVGVGVLPHLVLERVVEGEQLPRLEGARLVADADPAAAGHVEAVVQRELRVRRAGVRPHVDERASQAHAQGAQPLQVHREPLRRRGHGAAKVADDGAGGGR